jgi:hypothetical protein
MTAATLIAAPEVTPAPAVSSALAVATTATGLTEPGLGLRGQRRKRRRAALTVTWRPGQRLVGPILIVVIVERTTRCLVRRLRMAIRAALVPSATASLPASLLDLLCPLVLGFLLIVGEFHLIGRQLLVVEVAGIGALDFLQRLRKDILGVLHRVIDRHASHQLELLDLILGREPNRVHWAADIAEDFSQGADDGSILLAQH